MSLKVCHFQKILHPDREGISNAIERQGGVLPFWLQSTVPELIFAILGTETLFRGQVHHSWDLISPFCDFFPGLAFVVLGILPFLGLFFDVLGTPQRIAAMAPKKAAARRRGRRLSG